MKEIALIGLSQSVFFAVLLFLKKRRQLKDNLLLFFILCIASELLFRFLVYSDSYFYRSSFVLLDIVYWALFGPVLVLYSKSIINTRFHLRTIHVFYLIPLFIGLLTIAVYFFNKSQYRSFPDFSELSTGIVKLGLLVWEFSTPLFFVVALVILIRHRMNLKNLFSNTEKKELNWLFFLITGLTLFVYVSDILWMLGDIFPVEVSLKVMTCFLTFFVFILGIYGYKQENIFTENTFSPDDGKLPFSIGKSSYQKNLLNAEERQFISQKLHQLMRQEKPYLESEITISDIAKKIDVAVYKLSRVINEDYHQNFFDFINTYRINEVKQLLKSETTTDAKIESLAYDCGFNSKSSFYSIFKKHTKLTPTEFRNN